MTLTGFAMRLFFNIIHTTSSSHQFPLIPSSRERLDNYHLDTTRQV